MIAFCTYCSAEKNYRGEPLPAIELYQSARIASIHDKASENGIKFVILSGKYGAIDPDQIIDHYDHLLRESEVEEHADLVASQLKEKNISRIVFFMSPIQNDENIKAYVDCITAACGKLDIPIEFREEIYSD